MSPFSKVKITLVGFGSYCTDCIGWEDEQYLRKDMEGSGRGMHEVTITLNSVETE
jgi:hypothetical protein